ncbi:aldose 1-epimerase family protein [Endozoicomonas ascidiicola]|uniref:aldose 1-epimerase family protein n=2 Tax=Endozoicomonas ascidiicola TaxID=1698521 RepID=UPI0008316730|nr:aldose 1-epimerase family protein [Endozoicomonas ascidiicola]
MSGQIFLNKDHFSTESKCLFKNDAFRVETFRYNSGVEAITIISPEGKVTVLPYMGQMIWDAEFRGVNMKMENMFKEPKQTDQIVGTYGCFAYHSGLIRNGCPSPADDHPLHGEMPCAKMDKAWLTVSDDEVTIHGDYEYVMGFGDHYLASPSVTMHSGRPEMDIVMSVTNLASVDMPLQYMCHTNYAYVPGAEFKQNIAEEAIKLRETIPAHVKPTEQWLAYNEQLKTNPTALNTLNQPEMYDPEIVFFMDELPKYADEAQFEMVAPDGTTFFSRFNTHELPYATRWILHNGDQKVAAFVLPATCRPEGHIAAKNSGTLISLASGATKSFRITTGLL